MLELQPTWAKVESWWGRPRNVNFSQFPQVLLVIKQVWDLTFESKWRNWEGDLGERIWTHKFVLGFSVDFCFQHHLLVLLWGNNRAVSKHIYLLLFFLFCFERTDTCSPLSSGIPNRSQVIIMIVTLITAAIYPLPAGLEGHENSMQTPILQMTKLKPYRQQILELGFEATFFWLQSPFYFNYTLPWLKQEKIMKMTTL